MTGLKVVEVPSAWDDWIEDGVKATVGQDDMIL